MLRIEHHPNGPRLYVGSLRFHHGLTGSLVLVGALASHHPRAALVALLVVAHDLHDFPWRLHERAPCFTVT